MKNKRRIFYLVGIALAIGVVVRIAFLNRNFEITKVYHEKEAAPYGTKTVEVVEAHWATDKERDEFIEEVKKEWGKEWQEMLPSSYQAQKDPLIVVTLKTDPTIANKECTVLYKKGLSEQIGRVFKVKDKKIDAQSFQRFYPVEPKFLEFPGNIYVYDISGESIEKSGKYTNIEFEVK